MQSTLTSKGQLTLPKRLRDLLHLEPGDRLEFFVDDDGTIRVVPVTVRVTALKGMVPRPKRAVTLEDMQRAIVEGPTEK